MENTAWSKMVPKLDISLLRKAACLFLIFWKFALNEKRSQSTFYIITFNDIHEWMRFRDVPVSRFSNLGSSGPLFEKIWGSIAKFWGSS